MNFRKLSLVLVLLASNAIAAEKLAKKPPEKLPPLLEVVQKQYQASAGIQAEFDQKTEVKATRQTKKSTGRIWVKRPDQLRWETLEPDPNILVSDGKTFWFYTPPFDEGERGQVIIRKTAQVQTQFLNALLSGGFDFGKTGTQVEAKGESKGEVKFLLTPQKGTAGDVQTALISIDPESKKIERVVLTHRSGNVTDIQLKNIQLVKSHSAGLFQFKPDSNTDKIVE